MGAMGWERSLVSTYVGTPLPLPPKHPGSKRYLKASKTYSPIDPSPKQSVVRPT